MGVAYNYFKEEGVIVPIHVSKGMNIAALEGIDTALEIPASKDKKT